MIATARQYHSHTSYDRRKTSGHHLDWGNQPKVYKDYPGVKPILLPRDVTLPQEALSVLLRKSLRGAPVQSIDLKALSSTLLLAYTLTARSRHADGDFYYRSAASAGALYPTEIYVATKSVKGLDDGLYHFAIQHQGLVPLRKQDLSRVVTAITRSDETRTPAVTFFLSAVFFRSAWKYRDRSYRYHLLDTGHVAENLILALMALDLPFDLSYDFDDQKVNDLLGLDELREVTLAAVHVYGEISGLSREDREIAPLAEGVLKASIMAEKEIDYPAVRAFHQAGRRPVSRPEAGSDMIRELDMAPRSWDRMGFPAKWPVMLDYPEALFKRRSRRNFVRQPISKDQLMAFLEALCSGHASEAVQGRIYGRTICIGLMAGQVDGMEPGFYLVDTVRESIGLIRAGNFMERMAQACLDQAWLANAGAHFLFLANLDHLDCTWGSRGYRYAMMTAGRLGERAYVVAESVGLGCCGIGAFYDDEAAGLLGFEDPARLLYLVSVGKIKRV